MDAKVHELQRRLIALGFTLPRYGADGDYGNETHAAVMHALDKLAGEPAKPEAPKKEEVKADRMLTSAAGRKAIRQHEGERLTAYQDGGGVWTIGVGHTSAAGEPKVYKGLTITAAESDEILSRDLEDTERTVSDAVKVALTQNEFDALVSLVFNIGPTAFKKSTLLRKLNAGDKAGAADQFLVWNKDNGKTIKGLVNRRKAERELFLK